MPRVGTVTTAQLSKRDRPFHRPATAMRMPMRNIPSIDSGQNMSIASETGLSRFVMPKKSDSVETIATDRATVSARSTNRASLPSPIALVRHRTRSRARTPSWKRRAPALWPYWPPGPSFSKPNAAIMAAQATAPTVSIVPCRR